MLIIKKNLRQYQMKLLRWYNKLTNQKWNNWNYNCIIKAIKPVNFKEVSFFSISLKTTCGECDTDVKSCPNGVDKM